MDSVTTIIGVTVIILLLLPLAYVQYNTKKREKILVKKISNYAALSSCKISQYDIWTNHAIAIDKDNKQIFFVCTKPEYQTQSVNLADVKDCIIVGEDKPDRIEKLDLYFSFINESPGLALSFYDNNHTMQLNEELLLIRKWKKIAEDYIN